MGYGKISRNNDTFTAFRYSMIAVSPSARRIFLSGQHTREFTTGASIQISNSSSNDGIYTVASSTFDSSTNRTRVNVLESLTDAKIDGVLDIRGKSLSWQTGDAIVVSSTKFLPAPFLPNRAYYVIPVSDNRFKLANSPSDAANGAAISFISPADGTLTIAQLDTSFKVFGGGGNTDDTWFHYVLDKTDVRVFNAPEVILGMQTLINVIDGYAQYQQDIGMLQSVPDAGEFDPITGRVISWQLETERFVDWAYGLRNSRLSINDTYPIVASPSTGMVTFTGLVPTWVSGTAVSLSTTGTLPVPLLAGEKYYVIQTTSPGQIRLSTSPATSDATSYIDFSTDGSGILSIGVYDKKRVFPRFELNPARNNVWIDTPQGVLANVIEGPYSDIRVQQTIFDQYNRPISADRLVVYRQDERTRISIKPEIQNDIDPGYGSDPYNFIHIAGGHFFVEGFEHFLLLNDTTVDGSLIYDQFLGLSTNKFNVDYFEKKDYTLRPTLGGYFLIDNQFLRNLEGSTTDVQNYYDILALAEGSSVAQHSRALVGYSGRSNFLDLLNVNSKSQFLFYRGMIQAKGSLNSVNAYINSKRFVDAKIDEFWAWKLAEFGDNRVRLYPEINVFTSDMTDDLRYEFLGITESTTGTPEIVAEYYDSQAKFFNLVTMKDEVRWVDFPEQKQKVQSPLFLDGEATSMTVIYAGGSAPPAGEQVTVKYWYNTSTGQFNAYNTSNGTWNVDVSKKVITQGTALYLHLDEICDTVRVVKRTLSGSDFNNYTTTVMQPGTSTGKFARVNSELLRFNTSDFVGLILVFAVNAASDRISPMRLIDNKSHTVVQEITSWHPARGDHYGYAVAGIDLTRDSDPAQYTNTLNFSGSNSNQNAWNQAEAGRVWWDTSTVGYLPYYDDQVFTTVNSRVSNWGAMADWAGVHVYKWVQSTTPPAAWDDTVTKQANDASIPQAQKITGTPKKTLFKRTRNRYQFSIVSGRIVSSTAGLVEGQNVLFYTDGGTLPAGIDAGSKYTVTNLTSGTTFDLVDYLLGTPVVVSSVTSSQPVYIVPEFDVLSWRKQSFVRERAMAPYAIKNGNSVAVFSGTVTYPFNLQPISAPIVAWLPTDASIWSAAPEAVAPDVVDVYVNGNLVENTLTVQHSGSTLYVTLSNPLQLNECDVVDVVRPLHTITAVDTQFDPDLSDDGSELVQWKSDYEYTINSFTTGSTTTGLTTKTYYYFWVEGTTTKEQNSGLSLQQIASYIGTIPSPFFIVQKPKDDPVLSGSYQTVDYIANASATVPVFYRQLIIRNVVNLINDDGRYTLRFTRDLTLRDDLNRYNSQTNVKDKHEQWLMFRRDQASTIDSKLWNKLAEALVGYRTTSMGDQVRVPSLDRELYDATYNTSTRIGLADDQAFTDKLLGIQTITNYLNDSSIDFSRVNLDEFFSKHSFDTPDNIAAALQVIYDTFGAQHVNNIWFQVLQDSFALRPKYEELMKTSWLALHGVRVLEVGGLFDD